MPWCREDGEGLEPEEMVAEGGEGVEGGAGPEDPEAPGAPPGGDEEDEGELNEFGGGDAEGDAEDFGDEALDEMEFDLRAVELHVAERGEGVGGGGGAENEQGGPVGEEEYLRAEAEDAEVGAAGEDVHGFCYFHWCVFSVERLAAWSWHPTARYFTGPSS